MLLPTPLLSTTAADIENLVTNKVQEGQLIDYKEKLPGRKDSYRKKFLADVAAFANARGGDIVFGVAEARDAAGQCTGIPEKIAGVEQINTDQEFRWLGSVLETGLDPAVLPKVELLDIDTPKGKVVVLRVKQSLISPHMVRESSRFPVRSGAQNTQLDTAALRQSFTQESFVDSASHFRDKRVAKVLAGEMPVMIEEPTLMVVHLVPLSAMAVTSKFDLPKVQKPLVSASEDSCQTSWNHNLDGYCVHEGKQHSSSYLQYFRDGRLESVMRVGRERQGQDGKVRKLLYLREATLHLLYIREKVVPLLKSGGAEYPMAFMVSVLNCGGCDAVFKDHWMSEPKRTDREHLLLPPLQWMDESIGAEEVLKGTLDTLWQGCGYEKCYAYDNEGAWSAEEWRKT